MENVRPGMLIYVSGPLTANSEEETMRNVERAVLCGAKIIEKSQNPFIPHLTYFVEKEMGDQRPSWFWWLARDIKILRRCDGLFYLGSSPGADLELKVAKSMKFFVRIFIGIYELTVIRKENEPLILYISTPNSFDFGTSNELEIEASIEIIKRGHYPVIPGCLRYFDIIAKEYKYNFSLDTYKLIAMRWFQQLCDGVVTIAGGDGFTENVAKDMNKFIFYKLEEIPKI
jgi:hypothetical protein